MSFDKSSDRKGDFKGKGDRKGDFKGKKNGDFKKRDDKDFKKKDGFARSIQLSRKYSLYRQNYCGCKYSERER